VPRRSRLLQPGHSWCRSGYIRLQVGQFCHFLNSASLQEAHLNGMPFTWSNEREHPTLEWIDRVFFSNEWEVIYPNHDIHSLSSLYSDHASLLLHTDCGCWSKKRFHFRSIWPCFSGFAEVVDRAWHCPLGNVSAFARLDWFLHNTAHFLKSWSDKHIGNIKI
jgi:hypothetical protein